MVIAVVAACAVLASCGLVLLWLRRARRDSERRLDEVLGRLDVHLSAMSQNVARAVEAVVASGSQRPLPALTLDFDQLVDDLVAEIATRTGADAVVLRVEGPGGRPVVASFGSGVEAELLERSFGPPSERRFEAAAIDWTYSAAGEPDDVRFQSALVTPLAATAGTRGVVAAYALAAGAFGAEHAGAVRELLRDAGVALSNARRFAEVETRVNVDPATGVPNRRGYELELGREVARAERSGRPLSVVVVEVEGREATPGNTGALAEVARLVTRVTRRSDIACRRGERELAILLPGTEESGATVLTRRLRDAAKQSIRSSVSTMAVGLVERLPAETSAELDLRIESTFGPPGATVSTLDGVRNTSTAGAGTGTLRSALANGPDAARPPSRDAWRRDALEALTDELADARSFGRSLAVVVLEVVGLDSASERLGREAADGALGAVADRLDRSLGTGSAHRLGTTTFALVLPGSGLEEAEALVDALQNSLEPPHDETGLALSAGITELGEADDADGGLGRAEHALWQAGQAGAGTIVVAVPNRRPLPPR